MYELWYRFTTSPDRYLSAFPIFSYLRSLPVTPSDPTAASDLSETDSRWESSTKNTYRLVYAFGKYANGLPSSVSPTRDGGDGGNLGPRRRPGAVVAGRVEIHWVGGVSGPWGRAHFHPGGATHQPVRREESPSTRPTAAGCRSGRGACGTRLGDRKIRTTRGNPRE